MKQRMISKCFRDPKLIIALALVMVMLLSCQVFTEHYRNTLALQRKESYGFHNGAAFDIAAESAAALQNHRSMLESGTMVISGRILGEAGEDLGAIGQVDFAFQQMEQLQFLEGRYPEVADEIAVENVLLDQLNLSYTLGEYITLQIMTADGNFTSQTYRLVGILRTYTINWKTEGFSLCTAFVGGNIGQALEHHLFFCADYDNEEQMLELKPLVAGTEESTLVYNSYSYPIDNWSVSRMIEEGLLSWVAGLVSILFLSAISISSHRKHIHRMRVLLSLGMDRRTLYKLLYRQIFGIWAVNFGSVCAGCSLILIALPGNQASVMAYLLTGVLSLAIVLLAKTVQILLLNRISVLPKGRDLTKLEPKAMTGHRGEVSSMKQFVQVERRRNRHYFQLERWVAILAVVAVFFCTYGICKSQQRYNREYQISGYDYLWTSSDPDAGLSLAQIAQLKNTAHIEQVVYASCADDNPFEGWSIRMYYDDEDPYCAIEDGQEGMGVMLMAVPEDSILWNYYIAANVTDADAFRAGRSILVYLPDYQKRQDDEYVIVNAVDIHPADDSVPIIRSALNAGDPVTISVGENSRTLVCDQMMRSFPSMAQTMLDFLNPGTVLVSEALYSELMGLTDTRYNYVFAVGDSRLSYEVGDKLMSRLAAGTSVSFINNRVQTQMNRQKFSTDATILTIGALLASILTILILQHNRVYLLATEEERISLLKRLGCPAEMIQKMLAPRVGRWLILVGATLNLMIVLGTGWQEFHIFVPEGSLLPRLERVCMLAFYDFNWILLLLPQLVLWVLILYSLHRRRSFEKS